MANILIFGITGLVGSAAGRAFAGAGWNVEGTGSEAVGLAGSDPASLPRFTGTAHGVLAVPLVGEPSEAGRLAGLLEQFRPDVVVNAVAFSWVDGCEGNPQKSRALNLELPVMMGRACAERRIRLVHLSSSYVFNGEHGPYSEGDQIGPVNVYGRHKLEAETRLLQDMPGAVVVRTIVVFGPELRRKNFAYQVHRTLASGKPLRVPRDQEGNPTDSDDLAAGLLALVERDCGGLWHVAGEAPQMSRFELAVRMARAWGLDAGQVVPVDTPSLHQSARRPLKAGLLTGKVERTTGWKPRPLEESLARMRSWLE